jgi:hypothetical protein
VFICGWFVFLFASRAGVAKGGDGAKSALREIFLRLFLRSFAAILGPRNRLLETPATPRTPFSARLTLCLLEVTAADSVASERFSTASINVDRLGRR